MINAQVVFRKARLHRGPSIHAEKGGYIPLWKTVQGYEIVKEQAGVKEWIALAGEYDGWYAATLYPNGAYLATYGQLGGIIPRMDIPPKRALLARLKTEWEMHGMSRPEWNARSSKPPKWPSEIQKWYDNLARGLPATVPLTPPPVESLYVNLTPQLQDFWKGLLKKAAPHFTADQIERAYGHLTTADRAFTNKDSLRLQIMLCAGATVHVIGEQFRYYGSWFYPIRTIPARDFDAEMGAYYLDMPMPNPCMFYAVNSTKERLPDGSSMDEPFPQLGGRDVPVPILSNAGISWLPAEWVKELYYWDTRPIQSPYNRRTIE
jgi:hypothetical protein